ncbi:MAG TPA: hypothetical protein VFV72_14995 [Candidatus Limnocylindrales bacterium]|nr:hypothetical protein [Candidatus Limnocylindrales bacterium]
MSDRESLLDRLIGPTGPGEDPRAAQFVRGLALGALVGAAVAGSTIWQRRRASGRSAGTDAATVPDDVGETTDRKPQLPFGSVE